MRPEQPSGFSLSMPRFRFDTDERIDVYLSPTELLEVPAQLTFDAEVEGYSLTVSIRYAGEHEAPEIEAVVIRGASIGGGRRRAVSPDAIRGVPLGAIAREALRLASMKYTTTEGADHWVGHEPGSTDGTTAMDVRRVYNKRSKVTTADLRTVVDLYEGEKRARAEATGPWLGGDILRAVSLRTNPHVSRATVARRLQKARELGMVED